MSHPELDAPFWSALRSIHAHLAVAVDGVARYPSDYAPFLGVARNGARVDAALDSLLAPGESLYLLGVAPKPPPGCGGWKPSARWRRWSAMRRCQCPTGRTSWRWTKATAATCWR